ncbi:MAG: hypothetical protein ACE365_02165 [Gammaproteobacteria bacterium]
MSVNVLILASEPFQQSVFPTYLKEYKNSTVLQYICKNTLSKLNCDYTFIFQKDAAQKHHLDNIAKVLIPGAKVISLPGNSMGSACTALYGACELDQDQPLLIVSTNEIVDIKYEDAIHHFLKSEADAGVMTFESVHPRYSYMKITNGDISEFAQQNPISSLATTGSFWFKKTSDFVRLAKQSILKNTITSDRFYIAPVLNQFILENKKISYYDVNGRYIPFKTDNYLKDTKQKSEVAHEYI